jgi:RNA polymerase sigma-70 factor (ECF subfamily)
MVLQLEGSMPQHSKAITAERARWLAIHVIPHETPLRAWLRRKGSLGLDVDDIIQETYAILAAKQTVEAIHNPKSYFFQVAYSVILKLLRDSRVVPIAAVADITALDAAVDDPSPEDAVMASDELRQVQLAIDAMPHQTRAAFVLRRVEGLSQQEIARRMNLSEHTIEKHISRGIKLLLAEFGRGGQSAASVSDRRRRPDDREEPTEQRKVP